VRRRSDFPLATSNTCGQPTVEATVVHRTASAQAGRAADLVAFGAIDPSREGAPVSSLKVTPAQLEALGGTTHRVSADVRAEHHSLKTQLSPLFGAEWSGAAAAQFAALYENFDQHAKGLCDALDGIGALLVRAGSAYAETEQAVAATFR
jgi:WXG100 family type VII secretion target